MERQPMGGDRRTDVELLNAFRGAGDRDALAMLLERHRGLAYRVAFGVLGSRADAEDAVQDAFVSLLRYEPRMRPESSLSGLVACIALRSAQRLARSAGRRRTRETAWADAEGTNGDPVAQELCRREAAWAVRHAVQSLHERYRLPVLLYYYEGLSAHETAEALGISHDAARARLSRAVGKLRAKLQRSGQVLSLPALLALLKPEPADATPVPPGTLLERLAAASPAAPAGHGAAAGIGAGLLKAKLIAAAVVVVASLGGIGTLRRIPPPQPAGASGISGTAAPPHTGQSPRAMLPTRPAGPPALLPWPRLQAAHADGRGTRSAPPGAPRADEGHRPGRRAAAPPSAPRRVALAAASDAAPAAAPLAGDRALDSPVTCTAVDQPLGQVLAELAKHAGVEMAADDLIAGQPVSLAARECALRDLMEAIAGLARAHWQAGPGGGYRLAEEAKEPPGEFLPPAIDTDRLLSDLAAACPRSLRPPRGMGEPAPRGPYLSLSMGAVYSALTNGQRNTIEDGGEVSFAEVPSSGRRILRQYRVEVARQEIGRVLIPPWHVDPARLGIRVQAASGSAGGAGLYWELVVRPTEPEGPWQPAAVAIPQHPLLAGAESRPEKRETTTLGAAAARIALPPGMAVVVGPGGQATAGEPKGNTAEEQLRSLLPGGGTVAGYRWHWERSGKAWWLAIEWLRPPQPAELEKCRKLLERSLPAEYARLFAMPPIERWQAVAAPWTKLWGCLTEEQRKPGAVITADRMTPEQRRWLDAGLQALAVHAFWPILEGVLGGDVERTVVSLDFEEPWAMHSGMGCPRRLRCRGANVLLAGPVGNLPAFLRLLPNEDPVLGKRADLEVKDEPASDVAARVSEALGVPVVLEEPEKEARLTGTFRQRTGRLLMHWLERHTGLQWSRRGGTYVLCEPVSSAALLADGRRTLDALMKEAAAQPEGTFADALGTMGGSLTIDDRRALAAGRVRLADLSTGLQAAVEGLLVSFAHAQVTDVEESWRLLERMDEARLRMRDAGAWTVVSVELPGGAAREFRLPRDAQPPGGARQPGER